MSEGNSPNLFKDSDEFWVWLGLTSIQDTERTEWVVYHVKSEITRRCLESEIETTKELIRQEYQNERSCG